MMQMQIESTECFTEYLVHNSYHSSSSILPREIVKKYRGVFNPILYFMYYKEKHELVSESIISVFYFQFISAA